MRTKAIAYARALQEADLERQLDSIRDFVRRTQEMEIVDIVIEPPPCHDETRFPWPKLRQVFQTLHSDPETIFVIQNLTRLSRRLANQEIVCEHFRLHKLKMHTLQSRPDGRDRKLIREALQYQEKFETAIRAMKLVGMRRNKKRKTGQAEGQKPYGYFPNEIETLEQMKTMRTAGLTYTAIALRLNEAGIGPRTGEYWHINTVRRILKRVS